MWQTVTYALMCKLPEVGRVKTRLTPALTPEQACELHRLFLMHLIDRIVTLPMDLPFIVFDPAERREQALALMGDIVLAENVIPQCEGDLGQRLAGATERIRQERPGRPILFLGADSPDVPLSHLQQAGRLTGQGDVVLGPAADGGYWCLGVGANVIVQTLLAGVQWSSGAECAQTISNAGMHGYSIALADAWQDVDRPEDLLALSGRLAASQDPADKRLLEHVAPFKDALLPAGPADSNPADATDPAARENN
ncbi:MAG: TIGR04282 family arsenosugar biosynthesis glycosyltransferase [Phycisphaerae bacterium]